MTILRFVSKNIKKALWNLAKHHFMKLAFVNKLLHVNCNLITHSYIHSEKKTIIFYVFSHYFGGAGSTAWSLARKRAAEAENENRGTASVIISVVWAILAALILELFCSIIVTLQLDHDSVMTLKFKYIRNTRLTF